MSISKCFYARGVIVGKSECFNINIGVGEDSIKSPWLSN